MRNTKQMSKVNFVTHKNGRRKKCYDILLHWPGREELC